MTAEYKVLPKRFPWGHQAIPFVITVVVSQIEKSLDNKNYTLPVFIDIECAYNKFHLPSEKLQQP